MVTEEGLIFEIKGSVHPDDRYIAYLRYVPDKRGTRKSDADKGYTKIYDIEKRRIFLRRNFPQYLWFDQYSNRQMQAVPHEKIDFILNPVDALRHMRDKGKHVLDLEKSTTSLVDALLDVSKIQESCIGVTGSQLVGLSGPTSDIDLVVYGEKSCKQLYHSLERDWESISGLRRYENHLLEKHVRFRWGTDNRSFAWLQKREQSKLLQGLYENFEFFIRLVKYPHEVGWKYGERTHSFIKKEIVVEGIITDDSQGIFTPCEYTISCEEHPSLKRVISFRGRFTEHVDKGMLVRAHGRLESVSSVKEGITSQYLILGESAKDFLIPVE
ncbi:MAG: nucleotidyltransferase domain-containing protein [Candidatus Thorarchaeota archaeon]